MKKTIDHYLALPYRMEVVPDTEEGGFTVWYPDLPGCLTCSETVEGAIANARGREGGMAQGGLGRRA